MDKVFEPYFTGKKNGMGLGLATTLNILHAHHGRIDVQSEVGEGTTFTVSFSEK
jgi:signal transduction histidine kinase